MRFAILFGSLFLMLTACNSVKFTPPPVAESSQATPPPVVPVVCSAGDSAWVPGNPTQVQCPTACSDGSFLQCAATQEKEQVCQDNAMVDSGKTRVGTVGTPIGSCPVVPPPPPPPPVVCNVGDSKWVAGGTSQTTCPTACWDGSHLQCSDTLEKEQVCKNNAYVDSGNTRIASVGSAIGSCPVQPPPPPVYKPVTETLTTPPSGKADILMILDTTESMDQKLNRLAAQLSHLTENLKGLDWQIAITNAGAGRGIWTPGHAFGKIFQFQDDSAGRSILTSKDSDVPYYLNMTVGRGNDIEWDGGRCGNQPYCMSFAPEPMSALVSAMGEKNGADKGLFRKDAYLVPLIVSDADENENGVGIAYTTSQVQAQFQKQLGSTMKGMSAFGIIVKPGDTACMAQNAGVIVGGGYGNVLSQFVTATGGQNISICSTDFGPGLKQIADAVRDKISSVDLAQVPADGQVTVTVTPAVAGLTWTLVGKHLTFSKPLPGNAKVVITYKVLNN